MKNLFSMKLHSAFSILFTFVLLNIQAQEIPASMKKITSVEGITEYYMPKNGLKILLFPDPSKQTMTVNITYMVGSRHEGYGETGMAHLLEHMVFKGTPKHPNVPKELNDHGCRFNGTTWVDRTNYFETFTASDENLEWALDLESDRMINSHIAKKDLESEFSVVRNEFEMGENNPAAILEERVMSTAYLWHNYGKSTIGNRSDLENVPIENLQAFYRKFYQPDNTILLVAGKIDEAKTLKLIDKYFAKIPKPTRVLQNTWSVEPTQDGERNVVLKRVGDLQVVSCGYHIPSGAHPDFAAIEILTDALSDEPSGRLYKNLVSVNKAAGLSGYAYQFKDPSFVYFSVDVRKEQSLDEAKSILLGTLNGLKTNPLTEEDVKRTKTAILKQLEQSYRNSERTGTLLSEYMALGDWRMFFIARDNIEKVTLADVSRVANAYFKPSNRTVGVFLPELKPDRAEIPPTPDISALVDGYKGKAEVSKGEAFDPSCTNIEARTKRGNIGLIKYAFLNKTTRGQSVNASITLRFGDENSLKNKAEIAFLTANMLAKGTKTMSQQQIKDKFDELKASVSINGSQDKAFAQIQTTKDNLPEVLKLVTDVFKNATIPDKEFEEYRQQALAQTEQELSDPQAIAVNAYRRYMNPYPKGDIRYISTPQEDIESLKAIKAEDLRNFHKDFYGASNATISIVGEFDEGAVTKVLTEGLGTMKSPKLYKRPETKSPEVSAKADKIKTPDKANAIFLAGQNIPMRDDDPNYVSMMMGNYILGGGALSNRLAERIRQKDGLSYGVYSWFNASQLDKTGTFGSFAIYAPENLDKLVKAYNEELEKLLKDGISQKELDDAKNALKQGAMVERSTDRTLVSKLSSYLFIGRDLKWDEKYDAAIQALTTDQVNTALRKHLDLKKISMFMAGDFDKVVKP
jgi:zinc protease